MLLVHAAGVAARQSVGIAHGHHAAQAGGGIYALKRFSLFSCERGENLQICLYPRLLLMSLCVGPIFLSSLRPQPLNSQARRRTAAYYVVRARSEGER